MAMKKGVVTNSWIIYAFGMILGIVAIVLLELGD